MDLKRKQFVIADLSCPFRWNTLLDKTHTRRSTARRSTASTARNAYLTQSPLTTALASGLSLHCQERLNVMSSRHDPSINIDLSSFIPGLTEYFGRRQLRTIVYFLSKIYY